MLIWGALARVPSQASTRVFPLKLSSLHRSGGLLGQAAACSLPGPMAGPRKIEPEELPTNHL